MTKLNSLFRKRIGFPEHEALTFDKLDDVLEKTAKEIPFENICILNNTASEPSKENLTQKILEKYEGGLCYELNPLLYYFLVENNWDASLTRGIIYGGSSQSWSPTGKTHVVILLQNSGQTYLVDTGFGGNLPLKPVPLNEGIVTSSNGQFRVRRASTDYGDYVFEMKLKHKDKDWRTGYAFDSRQSVADQGELAKIQQIIMEHEASAFNKGPLLTRLTDTGNITLTESSLTEWKDGKIQKLPVTQRDFNKLVQEHFGIKIN